MTPLKTQSPNATAEPENQIPMHDVPAVKAKDATLQPGLVSVTPLAEIKSKLFGNDKDEESDTSDNDEDNLDKIRSEFLFSDDEYSDISKIVKKKRGRKSSNENSDKKYKKKGTKSAKFNN